MLASRTAIVTVGTCPVTRHPGQGLGTSSPSQAKARRVHRSDELEIPSHRRHLSGYRVERIVSRGERTAVATPVLPMADLGQGPLGRDAERQLTSRWRAGGRYAATDASG